MSHATPHPSLPTRQRSAESTPEGTRLIVGIDYGTTRLSVSYAFMPAKDVAQRAESGVSKSLPISSVCDWPDRSGDPTVPTSALYYRDANGASQFKWGHEAEDMQTKATDYTDFRAITLAKLLLHSSRETEALNEYNTRLAAQIPRTASQLVEDFLSRLWEHLFSKDPPGAFWSQCPLVMEKTRPENIESVFGVPAAWSEEEQLEMVAAAGRAGFKNTTRVSEPEAVATEWFAKHVTDGIVEAKKTYIVCDAGGGTVSYLLLLCAFKKDVPLKVSQAELNAPILEDLGSVVKAIAGVLCGSVYLNKRFKRLLEKKLSQETYVRNLEEKIEAAVQRFERTDKQKFDGLLRITAAIPGLHDNAEKNFNREFVYFSAEELRAEVFDEILHKILETAEHQVTQSRVTAEIHDGEEDLQFEAILLAGGFATNPYLKSKIRSHFGREGPNGRGPIRVINVSSLTGDVAQGLVRRVCLEGIVSQRRSKLNYGVKTKIPWTPGVYGKMSELNVYVDPVDGDKYFDTIEWFLLKHGTINEGKSICKERYWCFELKGPRVIRDVVYWHANVKMSEQRTLESDWPKDLKKKRLTLDLTDYNVDQFEQVTHQKRKNIKFLKVHYHIELRIIDDQVKWKLRVKLKDHTPEFEDHVELEGEESQFKLIGSLSDRQYDGMHKIIPDGHNEPMFGKKRRSVGQTGLEGNCSETGGRSVRPRLSSGSGRSAVRLQPERRSSRRLLGGVAESNGDSIASSRPSRATRNNREDHDVVRSIETTGSRTISPVGS